MTHVFLICAVLLPLTAHALNSAATSGPKQVAPLILRDGIDRYALGSHVEYLEDTSGALTIQDVSSLPFAERFARCDRETPNFGLGDTVYWLRFRIADQSSTPREWLLEQQFPKMRTFDLYIPKNNRSFEVISFGDNSPIIRKALPHRNPLFPLPLSRNSTTFYIRASVGTLMVFPLVIHSRDTFLAQDAAVLLGFGFYFGVMLAMALYNLYLFVFMRDRVYLYYVLYVVTFSIMLMTLYGFVRHYLLPGNSLFDNCVFRVFVIAAALSSVAFSRQFLKVDYYAPRMNRCLLGLITLDIILIPVVSFLPILPSLIILDLNTLAVALLATSTAFICYYKGFKPARYYIMARICLYISVFAFAFNMAVIRNYNFIYFYGMLAGSLLDVVLLSLGLADRVSIMRREKEKAEADSVRAGSRALIGEMAAGVAHEVNNPLAGVMLCFKAILKSRDGDPERQELIEAVDTGLVKIQNTVAQLLNFSRMSETAMKPARIADIVGNVLPLCKYQLEKSNIKVVTNLTGNLPAQQLDENKMGQVLVNLIFNASHAMHNGGTITISAVREDDWCGLSVADTGEGIAPDVLPRIFEPFFSTKEVGKGTGLGLSMSKTIVEAHGGTIRMESRQGVGTTCFIRLPL